MQTIPADSAWDTFVNAHPWIALGLLVAGSLVFATLPVLLVRRFLVLPHPSDERLVILPRRWVRVLVSWLLPAPLAGIFVVGVWLGLRAAAGIGPVREWVLGLALGLILSAPLVGIVWAVRAVMLAGVRATESGVFLQGSFLPWTAVTDIRAEPSGVLLATPASWLLKRRVLHSLGWSLDEDAVAELERLWRAGARHGDLSPGRR